MAGRTLGNYKNGGMDWKNQFRRPLSLSDQMVIAKVLVGIVVGLFLVALCIYFYFAGWP
jgi:hypothetical protein